MIAREANAICFPYTLPTIITGTLNSTNGTPFQILRDPPLFNQGTYSGSKVYNVNSIVLYSGVYYQAITLGTEIPLGGDPYRQVFTGSFSDGLSDVRNYCTANGIYASLYLDSQKDCSSILDELCEIANCVAVWNGQSLDFYPYSEVSAVGGGYTYTPRTAGGPLASFDTRHLVVGGNEAPIIVKQEKMQSVVNILDINYSYAGYDQAADTTTGMSSYPSYQSNNVRLCDAEHVWLYGPMNGSPKGFDAYITDAQVATHVGWPILKRQRFADPYAMEFKLPST